MSIMEIAIGVVCTVLMFGAVIWILVLEYKGDDKTENSEEDNNQNSDEKPKKDKQ